jgi:catechol 2,3-dioxygenase-like lactoylglutathione lyase family enzyme
VDYTLELVVVPVTDVDRAKAFYTDRCGFVVDVDQTMSDDFRVVQLTPPGSACSISIGKGLSKAVPGSLQGMQLCVTDIVAARDELVARGLDISPIRHVDNGEWLDGPGGPWNAFMFFEDPDGNGWAIQEKPTDKASSGA